MTQQGQVLFYDYAEKILTGTADCEALCREQGVLRADADLNGPAFRLKHDKIASADLLIETVSGVMTELGERIIGTDEEFLRKIWTRLDDEDLLKGKKAYSFYKEIGDVVYSQDTNGNIYTYSSGCEKILCAGEISDQKFRNGMKSFSHYSGGTDGMLIENDAFSLKEWISMI